VIVFAGNHGVTERGVSAYPAAVTAQMVSNFERGGAAINQLCQTFDADLSVVPLALDEPTRDFVDGPAMDEGEFVSAVTSGYQSVDASLDVVCLGEMGIGNTTSAAAIGHALFGGAADAWTGPGTGIDDAGRLRKRQVIADAINLHRDPALDGLDILQRLGGRELAAIVGAVIAARANRIPVILDGFVSTAGAAALESCVPGALDHCVVGHVSAEPGHRLLLHRLGKEPLLSLGMRLGEATGAVVALSLLRAACACHSGMATFDEANVEEKSV
jgi:nicotinate-nucleotide--dimethylbenzimidazole phosphoribosyltransferase